LSLLYIINDKPNDALQTLEATSYGSIPETLAQLRAQLSAQALEKTGAHDQALQAIQNDTSARGRNLRLDIVWNLSDWPNVINIAEDALALRKDFTAPLTKAEQNMLLRLTLAYSFEGNNTQLQYLRDYYMSLFPADSKNKPIFDYLTNYTNPLSAKDIGVVASQISGTESFIESLRESLKSGALQKEIDDSDTAANTNPPAEPAAATEPAAAQ
jgi:hypothetical protein